MEKAKVYFSKEITPEKVTELYKMLGADLGGKTAVKLHSGEKGNQNYLKPLFWKPIIEEVNGTVVECNTAYDGERNSTEKHKRLIAEHEWDKYFTVDLMDAEGPDLELYIPNGKILKKNYVGKNIKNYDSMLVLSHFKGHPAGGYGGALKQLSIGCASSKGKSLIHSAGFTDDQSIVWDHMAQQDRFLESMADAAQSVVNLFGKKISLYKRYEKSFGRLRLLRRCRRPLYERHRRFGVVRPCRNRQGLYRLNLRRKGRRRSKAFS